MSRNEEATPRDSSAADRPADSAASGNFIRDIIANDMETGRFGGRVCTRFPPEPNGYLHIGHAMAILLDYRLAKEFGGQFNLRYDDTNPTAEEQEFVDAIKEDVRWLGADWEDREFYASDYFEQLYEWAVQLIKDGKAYVDDLSADEIREYRGTLTRPGKESPYRNRPVEENLDLLDRMRRGEFPDGTKVLRARIDMASPNMNLRDPVMYRIQHETHHRTGDDWCIYPMYDWAHGQSDSIEGITHSICTLEFEDHRPLYDWFLDALDIYHPQQIEFARLEFTYIMTSKRKLRHLVEKGYVSGWDDPRMPTLRGLRRRGYTAEAINNFVEQIGASKSNSVKEYAQLEHALREDLNRRSPRVMAVLDPLKVVITNYPEGKVEELEADNNPEDEAAGKRSMPFSREIYIERSDFMEDAPRKFFRMTPGKEVRLKHAYYVMCQKAVKDADGNIVEVHCTFDEATRGGWSQDGRKVKGTLHWVSVPHAVPAEVRLYDHLFNTPNPGDVAEGQDFTANLNPDSLTLAENAVVEPGLADAVPGTQYQFLRTGYFCVDADARPGKPVFNRTVTLKDSWAKIARSQG